MKIIILGAGRVGTMAAKNLCDYHEVVVIDTDQNKLANLSNSLDIKTITGDALSLEVLLLAGIEETEIFLAVTNNDEVNMLATKFAHNIYSVPTKIIRIRNKEYLDNRDLIFNENNIPASYIIDSEEILTNSLTDIIFHVGATRVEHLSDSNLSIVYLPAEYGGLIVGYRIEKIYKEQNLEFFKILALYRNDLHIPVNNNTIIEAGDKLIVFCYKENINQIISYFQRLAKKPKRIMFAGGGRIGAALSTKLVELIGAQIKIIEKDHERALNLSQKLNNCLIINGDATDESLLFNERIDITDLFISCSENDQTNMLSCLLAKKLGAKSTISFIDKTSYHMITKATDIDIVFSSEYIISSIIQTQVRKGNIKNIIYDGYTNSEIIVITAIGDEESSNLIGKKCDDISLPYSANIHALLRNNKVIKNYNNEIIQSNDTFVIFLANAKESHEIDKLFKVSNNFI